MRGGQGLGRGVSGAIRSAQLLPDRAVDVGGDNLVAVRVARVDQKG